MECLLVPSMDESVEEDVNNLSGYDDDKEEEVKMTVRGNYFYYY